MVPWDTASVTSQDTSADCVPSGRVETGPVGSSASPGCWGPSGSEGSTGSHGLMTGQLSRVVR